MQIAHLSDNDPVLRNDSHNMEANRTPNPGVATNLDGSGGFLRLSASPVASVSPSVFSLLANRSILHVVLLQR